MLLKVVIWFMNATVYLISIGNAPDAGESDTSKRMTNPSNYGKVIKVSKIMLIIFFELI